jgi:predicted permease
VLATLFEVMLPIAMLVALGVVARYLLDPSIKFLARINLYILSPALIFNCLANSTSTNASLLRTGMATLVFTFSLTALASLWSYSRRYGRAEQSGFYLAAVFSNTGNFGLPVVVAALGTAGLDVAVAVIVVQQVLMFTLGVYLAGRSHLTVKQSLLAVLYMPSVYAALAAVLYRQKVLTVSPVVLRIASLLTQAAIPLFLILLGVQLSSTKIRFKGRTAGAAAAFRLVLAPLLALFIAKILHLEPLSLRVFVLESAMPTAIITTMLAVEYNAAPALVSSVTLLTTVLSVVSLPLLLSLL